MKKIMMALTLCLVSVTMFAQLNFGGSGNAKKVTSFYKDGYGEIKLAGDQYVVEANDINNQGKTVRMVLGKDAESAKLSLEQLVGWLKGAKVKDFVEINQEDGTTVVFYLYKEDQIIMSYGNIDYVTEKFESLVKKTKMKQAEQPFGFMLVKAFDHALQKIQ